LVLFAATAITALDNSLSRAGRLRPQAAGFAGPLNHKRVQEAMACNLPVVSDRG
jgi:hypothetical protein